MLALLLGGGLVYLLLGGLSEAIILLVFATLSVAISVVQEARTERVLEALRDLSSPRALVIRGGQRSRIAGRDVVRGDLIVLAEGDRVPADAVVMTSTDLQVDESLLTGESVPVRKTSRQPGVPTRPSRPGGDDLPYVYSGSLVVHGTGIAEVSAIGASSEIGRIGTALSAMVPEPPRLQLQTRRLVRWFALAGAVVSGLAVVLYGTLRGAWLDAVLAGIALGMSMLPEELPMVLTVFMAMGAWRISKARVLTRRASAIETLGSATVLCTDKTGTLTENRMSVARLQTSTGAVLSTDAAGRRAWPAAFDDLVGTARLSSVRDSSDPIEAAFQGIAAGASTSGESTPPQTRSLVHSYSLQPNLLATSQVWQSATAPGRCVVAAKGAPEAIAALCRLDAPTVAALTGRVNDAAAEGLRVLGVARAECGGAPWPESQRDFAFEFLGLVCLADPLRASVPDAVRRCRSAGITVVMITGDYPATARSIARQAGLDAVDVVSGDELASLTDSELAERVRTTTVFARIMPEQKLRIVNAFKANGDVVAMTGDGVNDAPSLKAAHIGIAMGARGTDVAREASSMVLLDDDFGAIVSAVELGRRIYDNLRKAMGFIFAVHVPIAGLALMPLVFGMPILFGPVHIALLEMVIDPVCSLVFEAEAEEADVMQRRPRAPDGPLFSGALIIWSLLQGACAFLLVAAILVVSVRRGMPENELRALAFFSLVLSIVSLIFVNRTFSASILTSLRRPNRTLAYVLAVVAFMLGMTLLLPPARKLLAFGPLHADDLGVTIAAGLLVLSVLEALKPHWRARLEA